jgi:hypothetical protein
LGLLIAELQLALEPLLEQEFAFEPGPGLAFELRLEDGGGGLVSVTQ